MGNLKNDMEAEFSNIQAGKHSVQIIVAQQQTSSSFIDYSLNILRMFIQMQISPS